jgi:hypothetical protein
VFIRPGKTKLFFISTISPFERNRTPRPKRAENTTNIGHEGQDGIELGVGFGPVRAHLRAEHGGHVVDVSIRIQEALVEIVKALIDRLKPPVDSVKPLIDRLKPLIDGLKAVIDSHKALLEALVHFRKPLFLALIHIQEPLVEAGTEIGNAETHIGPQVRHPVIVHQHGDKDREQRNGKSHQLRIRHIGIVRAPP